MKNRIPPPVLMLITGVLMWFISTTAFAVPVLIPGSRIAAVLMAAAGIALATLAIRQFSSQQTTVNPLQPEKASSLVTGGVFQWTRNPMYLALAMILIGWSFWLQSVAALLVVPLFALVLTELQIKPEEQAMQKLFGEAYSEYRSNVRRWL